MRTIVATILILLTGAGAAQEPTTGVAPASTLTPMQRADAVLGKMTIEEKAMQPEERAGLLALAAGMDVETRQSRWHYCSVSSRRAESRAQSHGDGALEGAKAGTPGLQRVGRRRVARQRRGTSRRTGR
jgi:hypothetical protein